MDDLDVSKLKIPELRAELSKRGLNTFGTKQVLMDRLNEALNNVNTTKAPETSESDEPPCITSPVGVRSVYPEVGNEESSRDHSNFDNGMGCNQFDESFNQRRDNEQCSRKRSASRSPRRRSRSRSRDRDFRRSPRRRSRSPSNKNKMCDERPDWEKSVSVFLDCYNCDLNMIIDNDGYTARPQTDGGFSMMWAGVRANYGLTFGKSFFEARCLRHLPVDNLDSMAGGATHVVRVGWSTENSEFALGEESQSYGYGGTAKKSCASKFSDYGCTFGEGDVVGAFLEWTQTEAILRFSVNGVDQGECYRVQKHSLSERYALFPHIYVKNVEFDTNFGQDGQPAWFLPAIPGSDPSSWRLLNNTSLSSRVHGRLPPSSKNDCEVIMMIGLPGAGKTYYAERMRAENREKQYNVLGTNLILDKMKVMGLSRQRNYHGRWDVLIDKATKCLNALISVASMRRRNYVLDQTNVYPSAQRRKMRPFEGFKRKAIVIVPTDEEFRRRIAQREKEEGKEVPESAVLEMKANFGLPKPLSEDSSSVFDDVMYNELGFEDARALVEKYNQEGHASRPPPEKRQRWESRDREMSGSRDSRYRGGYDGRDRGRDFNRGRRDDFRRSPNRRDDRGRRGFRGGYSAERDRHREDDRFDRSRDRDGYGRPPPPDRFGGPSERFGAGGPASRGGFPPGGGYGNFDGSRGGMGMRGRGGPPGSSASSPMGRGGFSGGPDYDNSGAPRGDFRGAGDSRMPFRGGRGGFRGASNDRGALGSNPSFGGQTDSMYGAGRFDGMGVGATEVVDNFGPPGATAGANDNQPPFEGGGYRGGYNFGSARGTMGSQRPSGRGGNFGRGSVQMGRGATSGRGAPSDSGRGPDKDTGPSFSGLSDASYLGTKGDGYQNQGGLPSAYPNAESYPIRNRDRYPPGPVQYPGGTGPPKSGSTGPVGYQRSGPPNYMGATSTTGLSDSYGKGFVDDGGFSGDVTSGYTGGPIGGGGYQKIGSGYGDPISSDTCGTRGARSSSRGYGGPNYGSIEPERHSLAPTDRQYGDGSLYASGAARFGENRAAAPPSSGTRQSRFDKSPPSQQPTYSSYPPENYSGSFSGYGAAPGGPPPVQQSGPPGPRSGRSRFDVGPGATSQPPVGGTPAGQSSQISQGQQPQQQHSSASQMQGYGYNTYGNQGVKQNTSVPSTASGPGYGSYGYGYGYSSQNAPPGSSASNRPPAAQPTATPSLYASAVADKPQQSTAPSLQGAVAPSTADSSVNSAVNYAYYGYGSASGTSGASATDGTYDAAMMAAQKFNAWQQQPSTTSNATAAVSTQSADVSGQQMNTAPNAYANYYQGYSAYSAGYGSTGMPPSGTSTAPTTQSSMQQYYAGYR